MPSTAWCNDCATCATDGCYDTCATTEVVMFIVFLFILFGVAVVTALVATVACCYASRLGMTGKDVLRRGMGLVTLLAAGVSLLVSLFFGWHEAPGSNAKPPCSTARHSIGLTYSGDTSNGDYFASCSSVKDTLETMSVLLYFTVAFTALSFLSTIALRTHWQAGASGVLALVFLIATLGLHGSRIVGDTDFCGSGRSLGDLGYSPQSAYRSAWCAFVFIVLGGIVHPAVFHFKKIMPEGPVRHAIPEHYAPVATAVVVPAVPVGTTAAPMAPAPPAATVQYGSTVHYDV